VYKILVVDDVPLNIKFVTKIVEQEGCYEIFSALSGEEALEKIRQQVPDILLLDAVMPNMNGVEVTTIIRQTYSNLELPIIMITATTEQALKIQALKAGIDEFLAKPIDGIELITRIKTLLKNKELHKELQSRHLEIMRQMDLAKIIQQKLQSTGIRKYPGVTIESSYFPMYQIGGDIIFIKPLKEEKTAVFIGDASGHGISAALVGTLIKAILETLPLEYNAGEGLGYINDKLSEYFDSNLDDMYVTCSLCIYNGEENSLECGNAGHPEPYARKREEENFFKIPLNSGPPIGILGGIHYEKNSISINELEELLLITDGIFPMMGYEKGTPYEKELTLDGLNEIITKRKITPAEENEDDFALVRMYLNKE
jgi:sigma-B regulation protein RsbU (phosphoserine phosphatase)